MHFSELRIYKLAIKLSIEIDKNIKLIPLHWKLNDCNQIIRSSSSVPSNIVEGYAKKIYPKDFIKFLNIALGSSDETQSHIFLLNKKGYIDSRKSYYFQNQYKNLSIKILNLIKVIRKENNL